MLPTRRELALLILAWLAWAFVELHLATPFATTWGGTDQLSHVAQVELFDRHGFELYRQPTRSLCVTPPGEAARAWAAAGGCPASSVCDLGDSSARPVCAGWQEYPPPYPPGAFLYALADGLLYEHSTVTSRALSRVVLLRYLLVAQLLAWAMARVVFSDADFGRPAAGVRTSPGRWFAFALVYADIVRWTFTGCYDPVSVLAVIVGVGLLAKRKSADALLAFAIALFLHYRALWYAPLFLVAAARLTRREAWAAPKATAAKVVIAAALVFVSAYGFILLYPALGGFPSWNPLLQTAGGVNRAGWLLILLVAAVLAYLARGRHWTLFAVVAWQSLMILRTPQVQVWHVLFLLPLFAVARLERGARNSAMFGAVVFAVAESIVVFETIPRPDLLVLDLWNAWGPA